MNKERFLDYINAWSVAVDPDRVPAKWDLKKKVSDYDLSAFIVLGIIAKHVQDGVFDDE